MDKNKNYLEKWSRWVDSMHKDVEKFEKKLSNQLDYDVKA